LFLASAFPLTCLTSFNFLEVKYDFSKGPRTGQLNTDSARFFSKRETTLPLLLLRGVAANCFLKIAPLRPQSKAPLLTSLLNKQSHSCEKEPLAFTPRYPISILTVWISAKKKGDSAAHSAAVKLFWPSGRKFSRAVIIFHQHASRDYNCGVTRFRKASVSALLPPAMANASQNRVSTWRHVPADHPHVLKKIP
jgi:hypothetical protein